MIEGVQLKQLTTHADERGFFREILRSTDEIFKEGFGQWSHSSSYTGTIKAWHIHAKQADWFYCPLGVIKVVLCDLRMWENFDKIGRDFTRLSMKSESFEEFILGDNQSAQVLRIPPGVAHGLKVLQGPAHLFYITSRVYDPADEGRIPHDALGYNWHAQDIK